jgi:NADH dehydrogenase [ubiquinone] 1 alpha subcomplex assembly factor 1
VSIGNFSSESIEEIAFLIGNKTAENFKLEIDKIYLQ